MTTAEMFPLGAVYAVHIFYFGGGQDFRMFEGDRAFTRATEFHELAASDPEAFDVWLTRADGAPEGSKFVARVGRRARGGTPEPIPYTENLADPTEPADDED